MHYRKEDAVVSYSGTFNGEFVEYDFKKNRKEQIINTLRFDELRDYLRQNEIDTDIFD